MEGIDKKEKIMLLPKTPEVALIESRENKGEFEN